MSALVGNSAPIFKADAVMADGSFRQINLEDYRGKYVLLLFYPLDFTFLSPAELVAFSDRNDEFVALSVQVLGASVDSKFSHQAWRNMPRQDGGLGELAFPLIADLNKSIARGYEVLYDESVAQRALFLIDRQGIIRHQVVNDLPLARSVDEALRMVQALQHFEENGELCPDDWPEGCRAVKSGVAESKKFETAEYAAKLLGIL